MDVLQTNAVQTRAAFIGMRRFLGIILLVSMAIVQGHVAIGQDASGTKQATKPFAKFWISSLENAFSGIGKIYALADRPELSLTLTNRLEQYQGFRGIDHSKPLGLMWTWSEDEPPTIIFLPIGKIDDLMKTATFNVVPFRKVTDDRYEIERPGSPYHVLLRNGYAFLGDEVAGIRAINTRPDQFTKPLRDRYDFVLNVEMQEIPRQAKELWVQSIRDQVEPWLQPQDGEPAGSALLRRALGLSLLEVMRRLVYDVQSFTLGGKLNGETKQFELELTVVGAPKTELARDLNRLVGKRSEFSALLNGDASAGLAINWPLPQFGNELLGLAGAEAIKGARIDAGLQIVGGGWGNSAVIVGLRGPEAEALQTAVSRMVVRADKTGHFSGVEHSFDVHKGVVLHSLVPKEVPDVIRELTGNDVEVIVGQGKNTIWLSAGKPETIVPHLQRAIDAVQESGPGERNKSLIQARLSAGKWPVILSTVDPDATPENLDGKKDGFALSTEPVSDGIRIKLRIEEGLLRMLGRSWAKQIDDANAAE